MEIFHNTDMYLGRKVEPGEFGKHCREVVLVPLMVGGAGGGVSAGQGCLSSPAWYGGPWRKTLVLAGQ